jgi:WD40 repeat protein
VKLGAHVFLAFLLAGCDHTPPFTSTPEPPRGPLVPGVATRITYNLGADLQPRWLPDGSGFLYTVQRTDRPDRDRCFARMAFGGGAIVELICDRSPTTDDSIATFEWAAVDVDDRMGFVRTSSPVSPPTLAPRTVELRLGSTSDHIGRLVRAFPYTAPSGQVHQGLGWLQWLDAARVAYVAQDVSYAPLCPTCPPDTTRIGLEVMIADIATGAVQTMPGTAGANAIALAGSDTIYYTRESGTAIERRILSSGAVTVVHDFGTPVRDVTSGGGVLAAVTGPGDLWLVRPGSPPQLLTGPIPMLFAHPALSPDGRRLVVEGPAGDLPDLWLFEIP